MKALRIIPFFYLVIAILFIYDAVDKISKGESNFWLSIIIAGVAVFMFFFRRKFAKKMDNYNNQK